MPQAVLAPREARSAPFAAVPSFGVGRLARNLVDKDPSPMRRHILWNPSGSRRILLI